MMKKGFSFNIWFQEALCILHPGFYLILGLKYFPLETMFILLIKVSGKMTSFICNCLSEHNLLTLT